MRRFAPKLTRSTILLCVGILGVAHETLVAEVDRPTLLLLFAAMIGLPSFLPSSKEEPKP